MFSPQQILTLFMTLTMELSLTACGPEAMVQSALETPEPPAQVQETPDGLLIDGVELLHGGEVDGYNDHRVVMALSIAALRADGPVTISDAESIRKSYPAFFEDYNRLGGKADVINMG